MWELLSKIIRFSIFSLFLFPCFSSISARSAEPIREVLFDHIEEGLLFFQQKEKKPTLQRIKTGLFDLSYLGTLYPSDQTALPYFLLTGKPCQNCEEDRAIFSIRPNGEKPNRYVYPGKILSPHTRGILMESRAFFGKCLPSRKSDVFVVFQKERVDRRRSLQSSVLIAEADTDHLKENLIERRTPSIQHTLQLVKKKFCHEIEGRNRLMSDRPLNLHGHSKEEEEEEEEEEISK